MTITQTDIDAARTAAAQVQALDDQRKLAQSLPQLQAEHDRQERQALIADELSVILPSLRDRLAVVAGSAADWRARRDALAQLAGQLAEEHKAIERQRLDVERAAQLAIAELSSKFPPAELGAAIGMIQQALRDSRPSTATITDDWHHVHTLTVDRLLSFISRATR